MLGLEKFGVLSGSGFILDLPEVRDKVDLIDEEGGVVLDAVKDPGKAVAKPGTQALPPVVKE